MLMHASHLANQVHIAATALTYQDIPGPRMSTDSMVTTLPSQGWSCETLQNGIIEAARVSGVQLANTQLAEAGNEKGNMQKQKWMYKDHELLYEIVFVLELAVSQIKSQSVQGYHLTGGQKLAEHHEQVCPSH